jgi:hypothetical protein
MTYTYSVTVSEPNAQGPGERRSDSPEEKEPALKKKRRSGTKERGGGGGEEMHAPQGWAKKKKLGIRYRYLKFR